ncbi:MAG TPA: hypothetical protein VIW68_09215 [Candidatus Sulfotelmatobacter sp.]
MITRLFAGFCVVWVLFAIEQTQFKAVDASHGPLLASISNGSCDDRRPDFDWKISNSEKQTVYVYSTFLKGPSASSDYDKASHVYTIWTSLPREADFAVNDYPNAEFLQLRPGESLRGRFVEGLDKSCPACGIVPEGATKIALQVAFGITTESVKAELRQGHYVHPANPIVCWQQIAVSPSIPLPSCGQK